MPFTKKDLSSAMKRTSDWIFSQEIPSDVTIHAGGVAFSLHKFPLVSRSGYIRKLLSELRDDELCTFEVPDVPGGAEAFELAAKFCYDIKFDMSTESIAKLRCVAEFLEMTEEYSAGNLVARTEVFLKEVALKTLSGAVSVLHQSESLLPVAEKANLISRSVDAIAFIACKESQLCVSGKVDWWAEDLTVLRIDFFQRVLVAMRARGFKQFALGPLLMLYAQKSLRGLDNIGKGRKKIEPHEEHETRVVLETIVSLLPKEKNAMSVSFLSMLLRAAIYLETTVACRLDLEQRMSLQLNQAVLDDLLIPSYSFTGDTLFDVDIVQRIMSNYLENEMKGNRMNFDRDEEYPSPLLSDLERVVKLMETFLAEIASDRNLPVTKFIRIAELIPEQARITEDGMYRAIDIYLKAHPSLTDMERKKICSLMDCQKLSREACAHAAQNDRLPVQTVVQVLYYEQQRLRHVMDGSHTRAESPIMSKESAYSKDLHPIPDELSRLKKENKDLKTELLKLKLKLKEIESSVVKSAMSSPMGKGIPPSEKPPLPRKSFISSVSKKLGQLSALTSSNPKARNRPSKDWRHSVS